MLTVRITADNIHALCMEGGNVTMTAIVKLAESGKFAPDIAEKLGLSLSWVYTVLRSSGLELGRKPRTRTSELRPRVLDLIKKRLSAPDIAAELDISRAYVYRIIAEEKQRRLEAARKQAKARQRAGR